jgi:hypothetical protein
MAEALLLEYLASGDDNQLILLLENSIPINIDFQDKVLTLR